MEDTQIKNEEIQYYKFQRMGLTLGSNRLYDS